MATQQQMKDLLQALLAKGLDTQEALPTLKSLVEAKITSLDSLTKENVPSSISKKIQTKLFKGLKTKSSSAASPPRSKKKAKLEPIVVPPISSTPTTIQINRSPVLTLWATVVAQTLFALTLEEALTFGSAVAATCAKAKGTKLGIYSPDTGTGDATKDQVAEQEDEKPEMKAFELMGATVHAESTPNGLRAITNDDKPQDPHWIWKSLDKKFGADLPFVLAKMKEAAKTLADEEKLATEAFAYYVHIRPDIPQGTKGWGAHGRLDIPKLSNYHA